MDDQSPKTHKELYEKASEHWWKDEEPYIRPTSRWALIAAAALGLLFWWGVFKIVFG